MIQLAIHGPFSLPIHWQFYSLPIHWELSLPIQGPVSCHCPFMGLGACAVVLAPKSIERKTFQRSSIAPKASKSHSARVQLYHFSIDSRSLIPTNPASCSCSCSSVRCEPESTSSSFVGQRQANFECLHENEEMQSSDWLSLCFSMFPDGSRPVSVGMGDRRWLLAAVR